MGNEMMSLRAVENRRLYFHDIFLVSFRIVVRGLMVVIIIICLHQGLVKRCFDHCVGFSFNTFFIQQRSFGLVACTDVRLVFDIPLDVQKARTG